MSFGNIALLPPDIDRGSLWVCKTQAGKRHLFFAGQHETLCHQETVRYRCTENGMESKQNAVMTFDGWTMDGYGDWCKMCVDALGRNKLTEQQLLTVYHPQHVEKTRKRNPDWGRQGEKV